MWKWLQYSWRELRNGKPGVRFLECYRRRQRWRCSLYRRTFFIVAGVLLTLAGVVMLVTPGPGVLAIGLGVGLLARESYRTAVCLDYLERCVHRWRGKE